MWWRRFNTGLIDGDGSVGAYTYKNKHDIVPIITLCGTKEIIKWSCDIINENIFSKKQKINYRQITSNNTYFLSFSGTKALKYYQYIEKNNLLFMRCKWKKMLNKISIKGIDYYLKDKRNNKRDKNGKFCKSN